MPASCQASPGRPARAQPPGGRMLKSAQRSFSSPWGSFRLFFLLIKACRTYIVWTVFELKKRAPAAPAAASARAARLLRVPGFGWGWAGADAFPDHASARVSLAWPRWPGGRARVLPRGGSGSRVAPALVRQPRAPARTGGRGPSAA